MLAANLAGFRQRLLAVQCTIISRAPDWSAKEYGCEAISPIGFGCGHAVREEQERLALLGQVVDAALAAKAGRPLPSIKGRQVIEALSNADALVISGGGNLSANWPEHIYERAALLNIARIYGKPAIAVGQTLGPELTKGQRRVLLAAFEQVCLVGVREYHSLGVALSLGVRPSRLVYQLDDALFLEGVPISPQRFGFDFEREHPWIAVTVAPFGIEGDASTSLEILARELASVAYQTGARLVLVPHVAGSTEGISDLLFARRLMEFLPPDVPSLLIDVCKAAETQWLTSKADLVISMRYHPLVFATASGAAPIGIFSDYYTRVKLRGALLHAELQDWTMSVREALNGELSARVLQLWPVREEVRNHLLSCRPLWLAADEIRWKRLLDAISGRSRADAIVNLTGSPNWIEGVLKEEVHDALWIRAGGQREMEVREVDQERTEDWRSVFSLTDPELTSLQSAFKTAEQDLFSLQRVLTERERELASIKSVLAAKEAELLWVKQVLMERDRELASIKPVFRARQDELLSVKNVLAEREGELASIKPILAAREEELPSVKRVLTERERELKSIKPILAAKEEELRSVKEVLTERERELGSIKPILAAKDEELRSVKDLITDSERELTSVKLVLEARDRQP